jgi:RNA polymerase sigma-70 factor (ECF subfamily)
MFPTTRWTLILSSRGNADAERGALEALLTAYWRPLYLFLRRKGVEPVEAEDLVQGFFLKLLKHDVVSRLDPARGRLRSYLLAGLENHRRNVHEKDSALRRGGAVRFVPLETVGAEEDLAEPHESPEAAYEHAWALAIFERALKALEAEFDSGRRSGNWQALRLFFALDAAPTYAEAAAACGQGVPQFKATLHRARSRFREIVREDIGRTVEADADVDAELADLMRALAR